MAKRIQNLALSKYSVFNGMLSAVEVICRFSMMFDIYWRILTKYPVRRGQTIAMHIEISLTEMAELGAVAPTIGTKGTTLLWTSCDP